MTERGPRIEATPGRGHRGEETRGRVLAAASRLFATQGFDATSVDAVANAADITVPGMYKHFPGKHELLLAVARRATATSDARRGLATTGDLATGLADLFGEYLGEGQVERRRLSIEISRAAFGNDDLHQALVSYNALLRVGLAQTIATRATHIPDDEAARLAHLLLVLLMGAIHLDTLDTDRIGDRALIDHLGDRFARMLADPGEPSPDGTDALRLPVTVLDPPEDPVPADGRRARAVRTRRRILRAAHDLFALHGYDGTTIDAIAKRAEITVPGLYLHVASKEQLLVEVAERAFARYRLARPLDGEGRSSAQLAELLAAFSLARDRVDRRIAIELDFGAWRSRALADALQTFHRRMRDNVATALADDDRSGERPGDDLDLRALVFLMLFMGVAHLDTVDPVLVGDPDWQDVLRRRVPQLID